MGSKSLWVELMLLGDIKLNSVINSALNEYYELLTLVARDIYDSCIKDFYSQYMPSSYGRHGRLSGFNLYSANSISYDGNTINMIADEYNLLPYGKHGKQEIVFGYVLAGYRGGPLPRVPEFPMAWYTSYPNEYSKYGSVWQSSEVVFEDIFKDFCENVVQDTLPRAIGYIARNL